MALTIDGSSLVFEGTVTITNFTNPTNGVCTLTLTPSGGVGSLPALLAGTPGLPALFDSVSVTTLAAGSSVTATLGTVSSGGPGVAAHYTLALGIPQGAQGDDGESGTIGGSSDLSGTAAIGDTIMVTSLGPPRFQYASFPFGNVLNAISLSTVSGSGTASGQLASISVAAQSHAWYPVVFATGTVAGTANTAVNLEATLTAGSRTGDVVGLCRGVAGIATQELSMIAGFGGLVGTSGYGLVAAGATAVLYLDAVGTASTPDSWTVSGGSASFTVLMVPVS